MSAALVFLAVASPFVLVVWAWAFARKATASFAKAEVHQEFADTFAALTPLYGIKDKERRKRESQRQWMRLALCDPVVRDGLRAALVDADAHWRGLDRAFPAYNVSDRDALRNAEQHEIQVRLK